MNSWTLTLWLAAAFAAGLAWLILRPWRRTGLAQILRATPEGPVRPERLALLAGACSMAVWTLGRGVLAGAPGNLTELFGFMDTELVAGLVGAGYLSGKLFRKGR